MSTLTVQRTPNGSHPGRPPTAGAGVRAVPRRRNLPWIAVGILLVVGCALGFALTATRVDARVAVLVVARPVPAGAALTAADLRVAHLSGDAGVAMVPASAAGSLLGQPAAVPLLPGAVLTTGQVAAVAVPAGQALLGLALKPGQLPPQTSPGQQVLVIQTAGSGSGAGGDVATTAVVTDVQPATDGTTTVVTVQLPESAAPSVASLAAAGQLSLALASGGGR